MSQFSILSIPPYKFILPLSSLREVLAYTKVYRIPKSLGYIRGITPIRGELYTVLCIPSLLHFEAQTTERNQLAIIDHKLGDFAIEATRIDIISITSEIQPLPEGLPFKEWTAGMIHDPKVGDLFLLDFTALETLV